MSKKHKHIIRQKKDKKSLYMSIFIVVIMVSSGFGVMFYGFSEGQKTVSYNKFKFKPTQMGYETKINGNKYYFEVLPQESELANTSIGIKYTLLNAEGVLITSDPNSSYKQEIALAQFNLNQVLASKNKMVINAFTSETSDLPIVTCANSTKEIPVIEIVEANTTGAVYEDLCIKVNFDDSFGLKQIASKLQYLLLGVIDE